MSIDLADCTDELLIDNLDWSKKPKECWVGGEDADDDDTEPQRVCKVMRKDGLWQVVPMTVEQVYTVYAFATFGKA